MTLAHDTLLHPDAHFGVTVGADRTLVRWDRMLDYLGELERQSDRITIEDIGESTEGRRMVMAVISAAETLRDLDAHQAKRQRLSNSEQLVDPSLADGLQAGTKTVVLLTCGIHATEVGGVQVVPELVHHLLSSGDEQVRTILDNVILLLVPSLNPDGMDLVHDWYEQTLGTKSEGTAQPELYHRYAGHDNNRDWYLHALAETRNAIDHAHRPWRPHIVLDLHQMGKLAPRYVIPPYIDPVGPHVHPSLAAGSSAVGSHIAATLVRNGRTGTSSGVMFDAYSPTRAYQHYHAGVRILAEAASAGIASPVELDASDLKPYRGFDARDQSVATPLPWPGGTWRLRDIMDYHRDTVMATLEHAAVFRHSWIQSQWAICVDAVTNSTAGSFVLPPITQQRDPVATSRLLTLLHRGQLEVETVSDVTTSGSPTVHDGDVLIRGNQAFASYAHALLSDNPYPDLRLFPEGPPKPPYDVTTHLLPLHMGVEVTEISREDAELVQSERLTEFSSAIPTPVQPGEARRDAQVAIDPRGHTVFGVIARALRNGAEVKRLTSTAYDSGRLYDAGTWLVSGEHATAVASDAASNGHRAYLTSIEPGSGATQRQPRIALYRSYRPNAMDGGWARLVLDQLGVPYDLITDDQIGQGQLNDHDSLLIPHLAPEQLLDGNSEEEYDAPFSGGLRPVLDQVRAFTKAGGTVVALDGSATALVTAFELPVDLPLDGLEQTEFYCPGAVLRGIADPLHPLMWGMESTVPILFSSSTAFRRTKSNGTHAPILRYAGQETLLSGWLLGEEHITEADAILEELVGAGRIILIGFRPHFRAQTFSTFNILLNALYRGQLNHEAQGGT